MSFTEKFTTLMARPGPDGVEKDDVPWWLRYAGRGLGTVGGFIAMFFGVWMCLTVYAECLFGGIIQMVAGGITIGIEAPCCCLCIGFIQDLSDRIEKRPYWNKALAYVIMALPPIIMCPGLSSIFGSGLIFTTGVVYGMMALGRKGSREDMAAMASPQTATSPMGMGANVDQRTTLMEDPDVWRPT
ncbi:calcium channel flower isoform X2 [Agrilus planipennis]|uniref:Calcium channel flower n=1 Tax=Agrilus planipennis TaxID=224129 RepID=A0A1W4WHP6_AGRPL|nr:calcium channel flower isoform X2 [Agrilus planipennis]